MCIDALVCMSCAQSDDRVGRSSQAPQSESEVCLWQPWHVNIMVSSVAARKCFVTQTSGDSAVPPTKQVVVKIAASMTVHAEQTIQLGRHIVQGAVTHCQRHISPIWHTLVLSHTVCQCLAKVTLFELQLQRVSARASSHPVNESLTTQRATRTAGSRSPPRNWLLTPGTRGRRRTQHAACCRCAAASGRRRAALQGAGCSAAVRTLCLVEVALCSV